MVIPQLMQGYDLIFVEQMFTLEEKDSTPIVYAEEKVLPVLFDPASKVVPVNRKGLMGDVKAAGHLWHREYEIVRGLDSWRRKRVIRTATLDFRKTCTLKGTEASCPYV